MRDASANPSVGWLHTAEARWHDSWSQVGVMLQSAVQALWAIPLPGWSTPVALGTFAMLLVQAFDHGYIRGNLPWSIALTGALLVLFAALYHALTHADALQEVVPARSRPFTMLLIIVLVGDTLLHCALLVPRLADTNRYSTDAAAATDCATQMVRQGRNPYANLHMLVCLHSHGLAFNQTTPKRAGALKPFMTFPNPDSPHVTYLMWKVYGEDLKIEQQDQLLADRTRTAYRYAAPEFEERFNYPGGALIVSLAAWTFGLRDLVALLLTCGIGISLFVYRRAEPRVRAATGLLLLADMPLLIDSSGGTTDVLYALLLVVYWQYRDRPLLSGVLLGLAMAVRQQAWFFAPFLLYLAWRTGGWHDVRRRLMTLAATFLICNLPWIVQSPSDWLLGILGPMSDPLFAQGVGLISIAIALFKQNLISPLPYTLLEALGLLVAFRFYMRRCLFAPGLALLLPLLPIMLAWRSLHTYYVVLPLLAVAVLASPAGSNAAEGRPSAASAEPASTVRLTPHLR